MGKDSKSRESSKGKAKQAAAGGEEGGSKGKSKGGSAKADGLGTCTCVRARHVLCEKQGKINDAYKKLQEGWLNNGDKIPPVEFVKDCQPMDLEFGRVKMGGFDVLGVRAHKKRPKPSKKQLLTKALELLKEIQDPKNGQEVASNHSWTAAARRAAGEKVLDDPKLLQRSLNKENHQRQKSAQKWQERKDNERKQFQEKQQKRQDHIANRADAKRDRLISKREKKLLRPGFEGRKRGIINS
eukprot:TRINITY_DN814_c0_g3_i1.p1 TRINITY_DN814_c0_g3~~TRINITY_DN814_c0_g3_i1.p1  ORF type:complete len:241 (+),score=49.12 TRINITY_DN814_c0_g3_i1:165-887(+)